jgi:solute carrier family 29 (equilibrative nucleoside transporter), member 1/2/3
MSLSQMTQEQTRSNRKERTVSHGWNTAFSSPWALRCSGHGMAPNVLFLVKYIRASNSRIHYRNMFLAAAPYFQKRFESDPWIAEIFQSSIISVSTVTNLVSMLIMTNIQSSASYTLRINTALVMNFVVFSLLTVSTIFFRDVSATHYFIFILAMVCASAWAAGLVQNGSFALAASWGRPEYTQAIMAGQGVAGVLPSLAQVLSVLAVPPADRPPDTFMPDRPRPPAAFLYFFTAVAVSLVALVCFQPLVQRHKRLTAHCVAEEGPDSQGSVQNARHHVGLITLFRKLRWLAASVFLCFAVTMFFPVFTVKIQSVNWPNSRWLVYSPGVFIPLGFLLWNLGDLTGRFVSLLPVGWLGTVPRRHPPVLLSTALARVLFLPLYLLCNVRGRGSVIGGDLFYLLAVQFPFGLTNGWLGSNAMMAAGEWILESEREAAGSFMGLCLVAGLTVGSLLSFTAA